MAPPDTSREEALLLLNTPVVALMLKSLASAPPVITYSAAPTAGAPAPAM